jgi:hypothetical protein
MGLLSNKYKKKLEAAAKATKKLNAYSGGLPKGSVETAKYLELNGIADKAIKDLPAHLRARVIIEQFQK